MREDAIVNYSDGRMCRQGSFSNEADPTWTPLVVTPFHPDYPSTHSVASGVAQTVLTRWLGTDNATYTITAEDGKAPPRTFTSLSDGALDSAKSRCAQECFWCMIMLHCQTIAA